MRWEVSAEATFGYVCKELWDPQILISGPHLVHSVLIIRMTLSNGNIFRVTRPSCGEFTGHRWIPLTKASDAGHWCFPWSAPESRRRWFETLSRLLLRHCNDKIKPQIERRETHRCTFERYFYNVPNFVMIIDHINHISCYNISYSTLHTASHAIALW